MDKRNRQSLTPVLAFGLAACGGGGGGSSAPAPADPRPGGSGNGGNLPPPFFVPPNDIPLALYENHPTNKAVYDLTPQGLQAGTYRLAADYGDNAMFQVSGDGRIWWQASPDYEAPGDTDGDGTYLVRIEHPHNAQGYSDIEVEVDDVVREISSDRAARFLRENSFDRFQISLSDVENIVENDFILYLLYSFVLAMPASGPLTLTWSLVLPDNPESIRFEELGFDPSALTSQALVDRVRGDVRQALDEFEMAANLEFIEVKSDNELAGDIQIFVNSLDRLGGGSAGPLAVSPGRTTARIENYQYETIVHELGHVMGLSHPFGSRSRNLKHDDDNLRSTLTIMSYARDQDYINLGKEPNHGLHEADIDALQFLYGAPDTDFDGLQARLEEIGITPEIV